MGHVLGIDVGSTTTKIVGLENGEIKSSMLITAADPVTSLFGAFGKYVYDNNINLEDIEHVMITGVGASRVKAPIYGLPTTSIDEFIADGLGARYASGLNRLVVVSMGTGSTFVRVDGDSIKHIGGISMGGGTLQGLARLLVNTYNINEVVDIAENGTSTNVNLLIGDICDGIEGLPTHVTASLFGKARNAHVSDGDVAAGLIHMILETIGCCAYMSQVNGEGGIKDFVLIGNLTLLPQCKEVFTSLENLYGIRCVIPEHAEFCTALGAALAYKK
ncbi:MAG: type II pantothenate kinase [Muribaculaceae bacterium]|nr:type II pantothenate kinase [Muribaculaceae bacterium]